MKITIRDRVLVILLSVLLFVYIYAMTPITSYEVLDYTICIVVPIVFYIFVMYAAKLGENEYGNDEK